MSSVVKTRIYAGASRVCITPKPELFPLEHFRNNMKDGKPSIFNGTILDDLFMRVLVVENEYTRIVFLVMDLPGVPESKENIKLIAQSAGVEESHVICTATHTHSGPYADNPEFEKWYGEEFTRKIREYRKFVRDLIPGAVKTAIDNIRPAGLGVEKGSCYLNVNRNEKGTGANTDTYGFNLNGPADRDLYLLRFDDESGKTIALIYNFAVHACMMIHNEPEGRGTEITGDLPGRACRLIEKDRNDETVVIYTSGTAGDLNPVMMSRVNIPEPEGGITVKELGPAGPLILEFMAKRLVRDILRTNLNLSCGSEQSQLWAGVRKFSVSADAVVKPGNKGPVEFEIRLIMIGSLAIITTNGEIFNQIGTRLKSDSPFKNTFIITHAGQWTAYVKDDSGEGEYEAAFRNAVFSLFNEFSSGGSCE